MSQPVRVLIVGGGGVGTIAAYNLEKGGLATVTMVLRSNYTVVKESGFHIESCDHGTIKEWRPSGGLLNMVPDSGSSENPYEYVVCCTKNTPDVPPSMVHVLQPAIKPSYSTVLLVQNGLNIEKPFEQAFPNNIILSGVSLCGAEEPVPGHIIHNDSDRLLVGAFANEKIKVQLKAEAAQVFVNMYKASGCVRADLDEDVVFTRWRKLVFNAVFNPICALTNLDTSRLRLISVENPGTEDNIIDSLIRPAMEEVRAAAREASGVELGTDVIDSLIESDPITGFIMPSMQQDLRKGRFIEYETILGEALRAGEAVGVKMPIIMTLYYLCKSVQFRMRDSRGLVDIQALRRKYEQK
ncbi:2-dehydropantoate 2-reductase [Fusarium oxysporum f. sp. melonis 26406]|uniref:2-dehydropantoate 2-reductase n=1 Tax=Fusarium oxysporum f. sp. melonis 26406 TaxID=1089452 RepID=W9ZPH1_FUSOX|nr:2-dehydropantoate 2-reductase [Fusarium oxysporum f. sp. melonis 26406]